MDVEQYGLEAEPVTYNSDPCRNLAENGATAEEIEFLCGECESYSCRGKRVELNAFTSDQFVQWIEGKLQEHGIRKVVPDRATLETAYRRAVQVAAVNEQLGNILARAAEEAHKATVPKNLGKMIRKQLRADPTQPWDAALAESVKNGRNGTDERAS